MRFQPISNVNKHTLTVYHQRLPLGALLLGCIIRPTSSRPLLAAAVAAEAGYGYCSMTLTRGSAALGYRWEDLAADYSASPAVDGPDC
ncbi:b05bab10-48fa-496c-b680-74bf77eaa1fc [Thermothielavioides terrestris]|uniref:B05bab10-48fa-496c-b680-74bf77eaa1fc n=1 Tax=Thermothielavioides terrestris TaxID=2587410 RepID=A0A3S4AP95_9PEZI|nr:b05bab10-48fa-496c-b680-74bf77eaa1fc [Thermothielavioides terrestris]